MRFLLTNDDGIDGPGLEALRRAAERLGDVVIAAPARELSGCGHQATTHQPIRVDTLSPDRFVIHGMPVDCVRLTVAAMALSIDWILSGINPGGNLGADVYPSGTVSAVREGALRGLPGIAFSHYRHRQTPIDWEQATRWTQRVLEELLTRSAEPGRYWNVNFPHGSAARAEPEVHHCPLDPHPLPAAYQIEGGQYVYCGRYENRRRSPGCDIDVCFSGRIAVTPLNVWTECGPARPVDA